MPEQDNDRVEQFFRKATSRPDVSFHEEDWKKLEARLDANDLGAAPAPGIGRTIVIAAGLSVLLAIIVATLVTSYYELRLVKRTGKSEAVRTQEEGVANSAHVPHTAVTPEADEAGERSSNTGARLSESQVRPDSRGAAGSGKLDDGDDRTKPALSRGLSEQQHDLKTTSKNTPENGVTTRLMKATRGLTRIEDRRDFTEVSKEQIARDWMPALSWGSGNKQKAMVILPGAEEGETGVAESVTAGEETPKQQNYATTPRLSLLLSFAPDFSSTSLNRYSAPGSAFGGIIHYHLWSRWSLAAGVIKNQKQYTGQGEDYTPPTGYWKYYTNGRIPNTVDGECSILEFPLMVQYTLHQTNRNRFLAGVGTSSYLMLDESYQYYFEEPNPGAREGWASKEPSKFMFNMVNFTIAYERQIAPGWRVGVEPYLKVPLEEIGWTNLKLFSTGASISLRYVILKKKRPSVPVRSRGPD